MSNNKLYTTNDLAINHDDIKSLCETEKEIEDALEFVAFLVNTCSIPNGKIAEFGAVLYYLKIRKENENNGSSSTI